MSETTQVSPPASLEQAKLEQEICTAALTEALIKCKNGGVSKLMLALGIYELYLELRSRMAEEITTQFTDEEKRNKIMGRVEMAFVLVKEKSEGNAPEIQKTAVEMGFDPENLTSDQVTQVMEKYLSK